MKLKNIKSILDFANFLSKGTTVGQLIKFIQQLSLQSFQFLASIKSLDETDDRQAMDKHYQERPTLKSVAPGDAGWPGAFHVISICFATVVIRKYDRYSCLRIKKKQTKTVMQKETDIITMMSR